MIDEIGRRNVSCQLKEVKDTTPTPMEFKCEKAATYFYKTYFSQTVCI